MNFKLITFYWSFSSDSVAVKGLKHNHSDGDSVALVKVLPPPSPCDLSTMEAALNASNNSNSKKIKIKKIGSKHDK